MTSSSYFYGGVMWRKRVTQKKNEHDVEMSDEIPAVVRHILFGFFCLF